MSYTGHKDLSGFQAEEITLTPLSPIESYHFRITLTNLKISKIDLSSWLSQIPQNIQDLAPSSLVL